MTSQNDLIGELLNGNKRFVEETLAQDPSFFERTAQGQQPKVFWIGCADSRVPVSLATSSLPGQVFVHRNVANVVVPSDTNMLSCLEYAVSVLKVELIIVCGHYGCGGVTAALDRLYHGRVDSWLSHIKDVYRIHQVEIDALSNKDERLKRLVELNVTEQVINVGKTPIVQKAWRQGSSVHIHGWVYGLRTGRFQDLGVEVCGPEDLPEVFTFHP